MIKYSIVLLDIDTQNDFILPEGALYVQDAEKIVPNLEKIFIWAKEKKVPIISSVDAHSQDDPEFANFPPHCVKGTDGEKKIPQTLLENHKVITSADELSEDIFSRYQQIIFEKQTFSLFDNEQAREFISRLNADRFCVFGVATDYCVKAAVEGLIGLKKSNIFLVEDAISAVDKTKGDAIIRDLRDKGVTVIRVEELIGSR